MKEVQLVSIIDHHCCHLNLFWFWSNGPIRTIKTRFLPSFTVPRIARIGGAKRVITHPDVTIVMADHPNLIVSLTTNNNSLKRVVPPLLLTKRWLIVYVNNITMLSGVQVAIRMQNGCSSVNIV